MVYIRPTTPTLPAAAIKPIGSNESVQEQHLAPSKQAETPAVEMPSVERRKRRDRRDRGKKTSDPLLETRTSKDRRKTAKPSISITI